MGKSMFAVEGGEDTGIVEARESQVRLQQPRDHRRFAGRGRPGGVIALQAASGFSGESPLESIPPCTGA